MINLKSKWLMLQKDMQQKVKQQQPFCDIHLERWKIYDNYENRAEL